MKVHGYLISFVAKDKDCNSVTASFTQRRKSKITTHNIGPITYWLQRKHELKDLTITNICYLGKEEE